MKHSAVPSSLNLQKWIEQNKDRLHKEFAEEFDCQADEWHTLIALIPGTAAQARTPDSNDRTDGHLVELIHSFVAILETYRLFDNRIDALQQLIQIAKQKRAQAQQSRLE